MKPARLHLRLPPRHSLERTLAWRYTWVTVLALAAVEIALLAAVQRATAGRTVLASPGAGTIEAARDRVRDFVAGKTLHIAPATSDSSPREGPTESSEAGATTGPLASRDTTGLQAWLDALSTPVFSLTDALGRPRINLYAFPRRDVQTLLVLDPDARVLAGTPHDRVAAAGERIDLRRRYGVLPPDLLGELARLPREPLRPNLLVASPDLGPPAGGPPAMFAYPDPGNGRMLLVAPVFDARSELRAVLLLETRASDAPAVSAGMLVVVGGSLAAITLLAGLVGTLFGAGTARSLARRLGALAETTGKWGHGDFGAPIRDEARDEIGRLAAHLSALGAQLQALVGDRQRLAAAEERNRLARELHDSVKQQLFALRMNLGTVGMVWDSDPAAARDRLRAASDLAEQAQAELAALIDTLRPAPLDRRPLADALGELAASWSSRGGIDVHCTARNVDGWPDAVAQGIYRIAQEALANAARHAGAREIALALDVDAAATAARLTVADDGRGFDPATPSGGLGLRSMRERAAALGGRLVVESGPAGTKVILDITIPAREDP